MQAASAGPWPPPGALVDRSGAGGEVPDPLAAGALASAPWTAWSCALCQVWRLDPALAQALPRLGGDGPLPAPGVAWALAREDAATVLEAAVRARGDEGPAALAFGLPAARAGLPLAATWLAAASRAVALHEARLALWLDPQDRALQEAHPSPLLRVWLEDPEVGPLLRLALAGRRQAAPRRHELLHLLASPAARAAEQQAWSAALAEVETADPPAPLARWVQGLRQGAAWLDSAAAFRALANTIRPRTRPPDGPALDRVEQAAATFLLRPGGLESTWEHQRWGVGDHTGPLYNRYFPEGVVEQALVEAGVDRRPAIGALLRRLPDELRWYRRPGDAAEGGEGATWKGIPPDADSLGLALQLAAIAPVLPAGRAEGWLRYLWASLPPDRRLPTWFYRAPDGGPSIQGPAWQFASDDCTTVRLTCMTGLLECGLPGTRSLVRDNLAFTLPRFGGDAPAGDFFYTQATAELYLLRFAARWVARLPGEAATAEVVATARAVAERQARAQELDGGWGSPHETGLRLEGLARWHAVPAALARGLRFLEEAQRPDGSWPSAPFYLMPGKSLHHVEYLASTEVTTALCLRAVHLARRGILT